MLKQVRCDWITQYLERSLDQLARIELGLATQPDAVDRPFDLLLQRPKQAPQPLPTGTPISHIFTDSGNALLILGEPGAGKTTLLLELTRDLLNWAEQDERHRIPVVFMLSSWAEHRGALADWLVDELNKRYDVPRTLAQAWVEADVILPLLDGLDEVAADHREACVTTINGFVHEHGLVPLVVCSRRAEYEALSVRLRLPSAVMIQPLSRQQIRTYVEQAGTALAGLRTVLHEDETFWEFLSTPLMLSIAAFAYQGRAAEEIHAASTIEEHRRHVFAAYTDAMFHRGTPRTPYTREQTEHWLTWLAKAMKDHSQTILYLEWMQPDWLPGQRQQWLVTFITSVMSGLSVGLLGGLVFNLLGLLGGLPGGLLGGLSVGIRGPLVGRLLGGLGSVLLGGLLGGLSVMVVVEQSKGIRYEFSKLFRRLLFGLVGGLVGGLLFGLSGGLLFGLSGGLLFGLSGGLLAGLGFGLLDLLGVLVGGLVGGLSVGIRGPLVGRLVDVLIGMLFGVLLLMLLYQLSLILVGHSKQIKPTEKIRWSWSAARYKWLSKLFNRLVGGLLIGLVGGLLIGLRAGLYFGLFGGLYFGLLGGLNDGVTVGEIRTQSFPNEGIRRSVRSALISGLLFGWLGGSLSGLYGGLYFGLLPGLLIGLYFGLFGGLLFGLRFGGHACLHHCALRLVLWHKNFAPLHYIRFLDYATARIFLHKAGGGYVFVHRMLLEYFAALHPTSTDQQNCNRNG